MYRVFVGSVFVGPESAAEFILCTNNIMYTISSPRDTRVSRYFETVFPIYIYIIIIFSILSLDKFTYMYTGCISRGFHILQCNIDVKISNPHEDAPCIPIVSKYTISAKSI